MKPEAKPTKPETREMPTQLREAQLVPASFNDANNTVECVWTTGARVRRYDYWNDTYYDEELDVTPESVDMARFDAGVVPVLDAHRTYGGLSAQIGIVERASIANGQGRATLRLSQREDLAGIVGDIKAGIIRSISVGYAVRKYEVTRGSERTDGGTIPLYRAVDWVPSELSFVPIPADTGAATRSQQRSQGGSPCEFIRASAQSNEEITMTEAELQAKREHEEAAAKAAQLVIEQQRAAEAKAAADAAAKKAMERAADITALCQRHKLPQLAEAYIREGKTPEQVGLALLDELAKRDGGSGGNRNTRIETVTDEHSTRMAGMEEAVMHRVDAKAKLTDNGKQFRGMSILEMAREYLEARGINTRGMDRLTLAGTALQHRSAGMLGSSDFSNLFANVANKRLRMGYEENPGTYTRWARRAPNAPDFKNISVVQLSAMPDLLKVNEHGEFKYGSMTDGKEQYALLTYGRIVSLTRQALVNDDLRAFDRMVAGFGGSAARLENRTVYAVLTANAAMSDTGLLFNATAVTTAGGHANLATGGGSVLQFSSLTTMRTAMRLQKGLQSEELNLTPSGIIVPAALEQTAYQLTSSQYTPATQATVNEFRSGGRTALDPIVEPILDANSATAWYAFANNSQVDTVEYCYLDGAEGPVIESEMGFDTDGMSLKCRLDFATKAIDWRGLYKSAGA